MKAVTLILAALAALGAMLTVAQACDFHSARSCAAGQIWDSASDSCVEQPSG